MLLVLILIIFLTFHTIYDKKSIEVILSNLSNINYWYIAIGIVFILLYFILQGLYMKLCLKVFKKKISLKKGTFYSMIEFYFSGITPSSSGGQPAQIYYMKKDKIPIKTSYIVLLLNTIYFKIVILILGFIVIIFKSNFIFSNNFIYTFFFILGLVSDLVMVILGIIFLINDNIIKKVLLKIHAFCSKFKFLKDKINKDEIEEDITEYKKSLLYIKEKKKVILITFLITFIQRLLLLSMGYIVYRSLGFNKYSYFDLLTIQVTAQLAIEMLPLPGGACLSENLIRDMYSKMFALSYSDIGMILTRTLSFYIPLLFSGLVIFAEKLIKKKEKKE